MLREKYSQISFDTAELEVFIYKKLLVYLLITLFCAVTRYFLGEKCMVWGFGKI